MAHLKFGDLIEIPTSKRLAYSQYVNKHKMYGALLRVFTGLSETRPDNAAIAAGDVQFMCFFPLGAAVKRGIVKVVGNQPVPGQYCEFPTFRAGVVNPKTRKVRGWWLWDGKNEWRIGSLDSAPEIMSTLNGATPRLRANFQGSSGPVLP